MLPYIIMGLSMGAQALSNSAQNEAANEVYEAKVGMLKASSAMIEYSKTEQLKALAEESYQASAEIGEQASVQTAKVASAMGEGITAGASRGRAIQQVTMTASKHRAGLDTARKTAIDTAFDQANEKQTQISIDVKSAQVERDLGQITGWANAFSIATAGVTGFSSGLSIDSYFPDKPTPIKK